MLGVRMMMATAGTAVTTPLYVDDVFSAYTYTGNGSTQTITNGIDLAGEGGMVWVKSRSGARNHALFDTAQSAGDYIQTNLTDAKYNTADGIQNFSSTGFSVQGSGYPWNNNAETYASWTFRKAPKFFDVVTYTGDGTSNRAIPHSTLAAAPGMVIVKSTSTVGSWQVYHQSISPVNSRNLQLNSTGTASDGGQDIWGDGLNVTVPTSSSFYVGASNNTNGVTYIAYLFAHDTSTNGIIQCGSFTGDGQTITLGYEPQYILLKNITTPSNWAILDTSRGFRATASGGDSLKPNSSDAEVVGAFGWQPAATGFTASVGTDTFIYLAIRRPNKPPTVGTQVYNAIARTGTGAAATVTGVGFAPDLVVSGPRSPLNGAGFYDRLRGALRAIRPTGTLAEATYTTTLTSFNMDGYSSGNNSDGFGEINGNTDTYINHFFRRAPGFFDEVCYTGTGGALTVDHNLGVSPELLIVKNRSSGASNWVVNDFNTAKNGYLDYVVGAWTAGNTWTRTSTTLTRATGGTIENALSNTYVAYIFATLAGISKVGSYTGTAATLQINCGFTTGARFVLIKRTDSTGDWYVWDTVRGIIAGNDPYLLLNSTAAEVTSTDYIDPYSAGFEISSTAPAAINASGGTYIFLAIA